MSTLIDNDHKAAVTHLGEGIAALKKEGEGIEGDAKESLHKAVKLLGGIEAVLKANKKISVNELQEAMANAELAVDHESLIKDDFYVFAEAKKPLII